MSEGQIKAYFKDFKDPNAAVVAKQEYEVKMTGDEEMGEEQDTSNQAEEKKKGENLTMSLDDYVK